MHLLLVDNRVKDVQTVTQSLLPGVDCVSVDFENDTYETLIAKIPVKMYESVGIFEENYELNTYQLIQSFPNSVLTNIQIEDPNLDTWSQYKSLVSYFKNTLQIKSLDLMGCNINSSPDWNYVIGYLGNQFQIKIHSSNDNTGSKDFGGNWILESGNQDLIGKYFSNNIEKYQFILGVAEMYAGGTTPAQMYANGVTIAQMYAYNIYESTNTLIYDQKVPSTTLASNVDEGHYNINLSGKNFKYYNLTTNSYTEYTTLRISTNGWLGFSLNIPVSFGTNVQTPLNTLRFFSFDAKSTIKYYFDTNNNLFISAVGSHYSSTTDIPFTIIIKVSPTGMIQVHYQSIGTTTTTTRRPIIGWTGNNSAVTTDDIFYSTFNGTKAFVQGNINGKFLNFNFTTPILTVQQMYTGGITPAQMYSGGITVQQMYTGGITVQQMYTGGITPAQMYSGGITVQQMLAANITPAQMYSGGITVQQMYTGGVTAQQMYSGGVTVQQMYSGGVTAQQMFNGGVTPAQMYSGGVTVQQMFTSGITPAQMYEGGITPAQMLTGGITITQMIDGGITTTQILSYNIYESTNTLIYDQIVPSTTLGTNVDTAIYNIDLIGKNFKYYNIDMSRYTEYTTLRISTNGWLGFYSSIGESGNGTNVQQPLNTLRFFSFDAASTIEYYFDTNNNLFISAVGYNYNITTNLPFTIVIKVLPTGMIQVHYQSIGGLGSASSKPIIGWTGNNSGVTTDDIIYSTFNGTNAFVQGNINGKFLNFDFTGLNVYMTANTPINEIYTYTSTYGYTTQFIDNITGNPASAPPTAPTGLTASILGTTATIDFTQDSNGSAAVTSYTYATSSDNVTYSSFVNTNLIKISATQVSISGLTNGSTYYFKLMANNGISSSASGASNSVFVNFAPAAPTGLIASILGTTATINFTQDSNGSAAVTSYTYATSSDNVTYSSFVNTNLIKISATQVSISGLTLGSTYYFKLIANNGFSSSASGASNRIFVRPSVQQLIQQGASMTYMLNVGVTLQEMKDAGFTGNTPATATELLTSISFFAPPIIELSSNIVLPAKTVLSNTTTKPITLKNSGSTPVVITPSL